MRKENIKQKRAVALQQENNALQADIQSANKDKAQVENELQKLKEQTKSEQNHKDFINMNSYLFKYENLYNKFKKINDICFIDNVIFYNKTNVIRAPLEAAITLYIFEIFLLYGLKKFEEVSLFFIIFFPLAISIFICFVYSIIVIEVFLKKLLELENKSYKEIQDNFKKLFFKIHIAGTLCYILVSVSICTVLIITGKINKEILIIIITADALYGVTWNYLGYCTDRTINWFNIYRNITASNDEITNYNTIRFSYYIKYTITNITVVLISVILISIFMAMNPNINANAHAINESQNLIGLIIPVAFTILTIYTKQMFKLFYSFKDKPDKVIFPSLKDYVGKRN